MLEMERELLKFDGQAIAGAEYVLEDSVVVPNFLDKVVGPTFAATIFELFNTMPWVGPVNTPPQPLIYGFPEQQQHGSIVENVSIVKIITEYLTFDDVPIFINVCNCTRYLDAARAGTTYHSDRTVDTPIVSISLGGVHKFHIGRPDPKDAYKTICERSFILRPGDLFVLGPRTNMAHRHAIVPVRKTKVLKRTPDIHISLVMHRVRGENDESESSEVVASIKRRKATDEFDDRE